MRSAGSLVDLARPVEASRRSDLVSALEAIDPFYAPFEHPLRHLTLCAETARELVRLDLQVADDCVEDILAAYETGLLNGYDAATDTAKPEGEADWVIPEYAAVYASAWRQGNAIRRRWRAYAHLVSILIGGRKS